MINFIILYYLFISILLCIILYKIYNSLINYKNIETFGNKNIIEMILSKSEPYKTKLFNKVYFKLLKLRNPRKNIKLIVKSINKKDNIKKQFLDLKIKYDNSFESFLRNKPTNIKELRKYMKVFSKKELMYWTKKTNLIRKNIKLFNSIIGKNTYNVKKKSRDNKESKDKEVIGCDLYKKGYVNFIDSKKIFTSYNDKMNKLFDK